ncbi:hypothetical protein Tco_0866807 [Tanacetum coccineum]
MATLKFVDSHNMVAFLSKPAESEGFEQIVDFLNAHPIRYALTVNPTIYVSCIKQFWSSDVAKTINREVQLHALVDGKRIIITETSCLSPKTIAWNKVSSTMASAIICLAINQKFNFSTLIFDSMVRNLDNLSGKFLMYPRNMRRVGKGFSGRVTPLFPTMVVQNQQEMGEGSAIPTDPQHTPTFIQSSTSQPQKTQTPRELTSMDTEIPQSSGPTEHVADEAVYKERGDSLVRAATTASSLEAEQDSGNIDKTQSKATLNEPSFPGTSSGSGPRCQETMGDTIAQTRFENVSTQSYDPLLARGNTLRSGEDSLKLKELMELCTNLQQRVLDLEKTKTTQAEEIVSLKRRVKKLEQKKRSRTHMLKRLRKVGATARVESSGGKESLGEDASKQGRIDAIDADDDITLVSVHDVNVSAGKEEVVEVINTAKLIIDAAQVSAAGDKVSIADVGTTVSVATTTITTVKEITLAQALANLKSTKPKAKGIAFREPDQLKLDEEITLKLQEEIDKKKRIARAEEEKIDEANIAWDGIQAKVNADYQLAERLQAEEQEQFTIEQKDTLFKELLEQIRKHFTAKRVKEKRNKPPTKNQQKKTMITYLKNMEGWKHKDLKSKDFDSIKGLFDKALKRVNMFVDFELEENLKKAEAEVMEGSSKIAR